MSNINLNIKNIDNKDVESILDSGIVKSSLVAKVLASKKFKNKDDISVFLHPDIDRDWQNPYFISGMEEVSDFLEGALRKNKNILIYGDYDLDGISSISIMIRGINVLKKYFASTSKIDFFIPDRFSEGYGFSDKSVKRLLSEKSNFQTIITVDCGITGSSQVLTLLEAGREVAITDHHESSGDVPKDVCIVDPKAFPSDKEPENISSTLSGSGVALKLMHVMFSRCGLPHAYKDLADIASLGTIADVMPLTSQNRALVDLGLRLMNKNTRPCIKALLDIVGKKPGTLLSSDIGFILAPRLNSAGRLDRPDIAVELLCSDDYAKSYSLALQIENLNNTRRDLTEQVIRDANYQAQQVMQNSPDTRILVLYGANWHGGVRGIVAAKIAEVYSVPAIVCGLEDGLIVGSGRSFGSIDLHDAIMSCKDCLERFGGHKGACGISVSRQNYEKFCKSIDTYMKKLPNEAFINKIDIDCCVGLEELSVEEVNALRCLEPFGEGNAKPIFITHNLITKSARAVGADKCHLSLKLSDGLNSISAIKFNCLDIDKYINCCESLCAVFSPEINEFRGHVSVQLMLNHIFYESELLQNNDNHCDKQEYLNTLYKKYDRSVIYETRENVSARLDGEKKNSENGSNQINKNINAEPAAACNNNTEYKSFNNFKSIFADLTKAELRDELLAQMIGKDGRLHDSQKKALDMLERGKSGLVVMPTGRGKSLIFQLYASVLAIKDNATSIFVYPLRALIADQAYHLQCSLEKFGIVVKVINGETSNKIRHQIYEDLRNNKIDILLTTPEYLAIHKTDFSKNAKVSFVVIDEAHHLAEVKLGQRTSYGALPSILDMLGSPQVLSLSATVNPETKEQINRFVPVEEVILDNYERDNLYIDDKRNLMYRDDYLVNLVGSGEKTVVYVNSRDQSVALARMLKSRAAHIAMKVGFYNAGMAKEDRKKIERMFRDNKLSVLVATSAFGEGVNISDIRHVCLYHLPFSDTEFNQMSGRSGRDGSVALVHLIYNSADASINTKILNMTNPSKEELGKIYLWFKKCADSSGKFTLNHSALEESFVDKKIPYSPAALFCAIDIFCELGLMVKHEVYKNNQSYTEIAFKESLHKVALDSSSRYIEGINEKRDFKNFSDIAMTVSVKKLTNLLRHPILPV